MTEISFIQLAEKILKEEQKPLSPDEIWETAVNKGYDKLVGSKGKTPWQTLGARIYVDIRDNPQSIFCKIETTPKRFYLKYLAKNIPPTLIENPKALENKKENIEYLEKQLHPFLAYYNSNFLRIYSKTIHHNLSGKKEFGEWVHPDMVGCYFPFQDWQDEVVELSSVTGNTAIKIYSFEIKRQLSFTNLREAFFQAVSNSSWANEGYLVAADVSSNEDFLTELKRLSVSFGIGIIKLNITDPDSSVVIFPARPKENLDWETINKLSALNPDFKNFIQRVKVDISSKEIRKEQYDKDLDKNELLKTIKKESQV